VLSQAVVDEAAKSGDPLPEGCRLRDLGVHRLRGLGGREHLYQLAPHGVSDQFAPLRTLDLLPIMRVRLPAAALLTLTLLALIGLLLPRAIPTFPRVLGVVAGLGALALGALMTAVALARRKHPRWLRQPWQPWQELRQPAVVLTSGLLSLVVVLATLFATAPHEIIAARQTSGYDFSYTYHRPTHTGGSVVIGSGLPIHTLTSPILNGDLPDELYHAVWNACVVQLPDLTLPNLEGWKADQCSAVPTVANSGESPDFKTTTFHIDPKAVWSDGQPLTADDFLFAFRLIVDPNVNGTVWPCQCPTINPPWNLMHLTRLDTRTVRIDWTVPYGNYLEALAQWTPLPLHVYARDQYAGVYDPATGTYNSVLAQQMAAQGSFNLWIPVDNGPFVVRSVDFPGTYQANVIATAHRLVLARNSRFFSNFFHKPALDQVTFETTWSIDPELALDGHDDMVGAFQRGALTVVDTLGPQDLSHVGAVPKSEVVVSPEPVIITVGFNQRGVAPNAQANGGVSIFKDLTVRKAFVEAFDRCGALKAMLGLRDCNDRTYHTDEHAAWPFPDYDPSAKLPGYNPTDAAALLDQAGYPVVGGVRRFKDGTTPLRLTLSLSYSAVTYAYMARRLQQDYAQNLHVAVQLEDPLGQLFGDTAVLGTFDIGMWRENVGPDPKDNLGGWAWNAKGVPSENNPNGINMLGLIDPWVVAQDRLGTETADSAQRAAIYKGMVRHVTEQMDYLPLFIVADIALVKPTICNYKKWPELGFYLWNMADWYTARSCP
jgi:ABC-type transport system substrate-binding protein